LFPHEAGDDVTRWEAEDMLDSVKRTQRHPRRLLQRWQTIRISSTAFLGTSSPLPVFHSFAAYTFIEDTVLYRSCSIPEPLRTTGGEMPSQPYAPDGETYGRSLSVIGSCMIASTKSFSFMHDKTFIPGPDATDNMGSSDAQVRRAACPRVQPSGTISQPRNHHLGVTVPSQRRAINVGKRNGNV
jgi:hypothetical protein